MVEKVQINGDGRTTKCAKGAKKKAKIVYRLWVVFGHYLQLEHKRFVVKALWRISRIS